MKSICIFPRSAVIVAALLAMLCAVPALARAQGLTVSVSRNGEPVTPYQVVLHAASDPKAGRLAGNIATFDVDVINASLEGKAAAVYVDECEDGRIGVHLVLDDPSVQPPPTPSNCRRRRLVAIVILHRGSTIAVDIGRGTVADRSNTMSSNDTGPGGRRLGIGVFGMVSGTFGGFNLGGATGDEIGRRFTSTSVPYDRYNVDVNDSASGLAFGGGMNLALGGSRLGAVIGIMRENERDVPRQSVDGNRTLGGLQFQQMGTSIVQAWTLYAGPTVRLPLGVFISGGPSFTFWDVELTQTARLQAGCPTPCVTVNTDNLTERSSGSDLGFQVAADYYPGGSWIGMHVMYLLTTYRGAYDPSRPLGYPKNWRDSNFFVGAVVGTPRRR